MDLKFGTHIEDHHISNEFDGQSPKCKNSSLQPSIRKFGPRSRSQRSISYAKDTRSKVTKVKVVGKGQGHGGQGQRS